MSYSNNVKNLILILVRQGHSPEETLKHLSQLIQGNQENSYSYFKKLADSLSVPFTPVDCHEIYLGLPSPKTIRYWVSKEPKPENRNQLSLERIEAGRIGMLSTQVRYSEEWEHFHKIKEAILKLQHVSEGHVSEGQVGELLDLITRERVTLDDSGLQKYLDDFIEAIHETVNLGLDIPHSMINPIISRTSKRMNKRYKRN